MLINIIGPESTGKTTLCNQLKEEYHFNLIPEFARDYCQKLVGRPQLSDVLLIAAQQMSEYNLAINSSENHIFDTSLITSILWLYDKFHVISLPLHHAFLNQNFNITFLCFPDLPWEADPLREDPCRQKEIYHIYKAYLMKNCKKVYEVRGFGEERLAMVKKIVNNYI